ncbi:MAG TPA: 3-isopropylmalate dehydratase small subunit [Aggregatilineales bacterium]|nr:3-isopropylmalate dehydratase small subunit [Aggregatilineales bacterium]
MEPLKPFSSRLVALPIDNIDTDQIIPARYLKTTDKRGLGEAVFADWRFDAVGKPNPDFPLNKPEAQGAGILLAGHNFGCGSSREHAPWALQGFGFKAVISTYFADIFRNNSLNNGLLPVQVDEETQRQLLSLVHEDPTFSITVDLEKQTITLPDGRSVKFPIDPFARECLLKGVDQLGFLMAQAPAIERYESTHPARVTTTG